MGLFDYIHCKYPLPVEFPVDRSFQTKDTPAQYMEEYEIREDGTLWHEEYEIEDRSNPNADNELDKFCGCMTRVNQQWEFCNKFTGDIRFYESTGDDHSGWVEFTSLFLHGKLIHLELTEHTQPKEKAIA